MLQFLRELHFIEALVILFSCLYSVRLQFLRELHFIEALRRCRHLALLLWLQFLRELHFIEAFRDGRGGRLQRCCSSFGSCTSLRPARATPPPPPAPVAVPSGAALH